MNSKLNEEKVLKIADSRGFSVHRYKWSHGQSRRLSKKLIKSGAVIVAFYRRDSYTIVTPRRLEKFIKNGVST